MNAFSRTCLLAAALACCGSWAQAPHRPSEVVYLHGSAL